ncbi:hypothetical protein [Bartonella sp. AP58NXGY]|uniref:hypothetical protein n=1 Tax=Bartonella sp. AP58NXGY TaxID=3243498 RepID=UPI0035D12543
MGTEHLQGAHVMAIDCVLFVSLVIVALLSCSIGWSRGETIAIILIVDLKGWKKNKPDMAQKSNALQCKSVKEMSPRMASGGRDML